ncbi:immunity protein Imm33 domain-containing protein [Zooshikella ganghwensis]|uniref:immunity protein Imm33 domain-containing protein n=1 Tax=Zooshikella ganghwensis TaxID=202772 RepID=UPI0003F9AD6F|nr:hypothetical protein [Zooshikella ganghwensis]
MLFRTTKCSQYNHPELCFSCTTDVVPQQDIDWFIAHLETEVANGVTFKSGEFMQLGWMLNQLEMHSDKSIHILEPNMKDVPIVFIDSVTSTLKHFREQQDIVDSCTLNVAPDFPSLRTSIIVSETFQATNSFYMAREVAENTESGWFFKDLNAEEDEYSVLSLYDFACKRPDLIKFLALPVGLGVLLRDGDCYRLVKNDREVQIKANSYLDQINSTR